MALFGAHVSSAGSILRTFDRAQEIGAQVFQFFLRSPRVWKRKCIDENTEREFICRLKSFGNPVMVHAPYLLNLASADESLRRKSIDVFLDELKLCDRLGINFYNFHPGTAKGISISDGINNIIESIEYILSNYMPSNTTILLENTAGEKGDIGKSMQELGFILSHFKDARIGVCLDTCHAFAYGYEINTKQGFERFLLEADKYIGIESIMAVHANDSKVPLGGRKDRHQHIGEGYIGIEGFRNMLNHEHFSTLPYYIETPKDKGMDVVNLSRLKSLLSV